jgi:hypothetical protein
VAQSAGPLREDARRLLAWQEIADELPGISVDDTQRHQLAESIKKSQRDLRENVWRSYKNILLLGKDNQVRVADLGLVHSAPQSRWSSSSSTICARPMRYRAA